MLSSFITDEQIVGKLITYRCKYADNMSKNHQLHDFVTLKPHSHETKEQKFIYSLFPPRSQWCHIDGDVRNKERKGWARRELMDSTQRNAFMLRMTYRKAKKENSQAGWFLKLSGYVNHIQKMMMQPPDRIDSPKVKMLFKKEDKNKKTIVCRPVCSFPLDLKLVFSLLNKYLTKLFDPYFLDCSYAFRQNNGNRSQFQHLDAVNSLVEYRKAHGKTLYVAECDMQKFYDTIDHNVIKYRLNTLMSKVKSLGDINSSDSKIVKRWFYCYIDSLDFYKDVFKYNDDQKSSVWNIVRSKIPKESSQLWRCKVKWVDCLEYHKVCGKGVPQGGALSGIIANVVMHRVDENLYAAMNGKDMQYFRFCDDMVLVGTNESEVRNVLDVYNRSIKSSKLFSHENEGLNISHMREFWEGKSRGPYKWGRKGQDIFPWITFVGFDINWNGDLRVRRKSFKKQLSKQHSVVWDLLAHYKRGEQPRYSKPTILESLSNRLIGMSVGRVTMYNYKDYPNFHCWLSAFPILKRNSWVNRQLKQLDKHRWMELCKAKNFLEKIECPQRIKNKNRKVNTTHIYGKPFSYYGQAYKDF